MRPRALKLQPASSSGSPSRPALLLLLAFIACASAPQTSSGCTFGLKALKEFDTAEYVFTGEVMGVVGPFESSEFEGRAWGLKVKVEEAVHLPKRPRAAFEVFPYHTWSDCTTAAASREELEKSYPVGSKVKVIATAAKLLKGRPGGGDLRLEIPPGGAGSVTRNYYDDGRRMTSANSVFDYRSYRRDTPETYEEGSALSRYAHRVLPEFELRKDLLRLKNARGVAERVSILERLVYYPECCDLDFFVIAKKHLGESEAFRALVARRRAWDERDAPAEPK